MRTQLIAVAVAFAVALSACKKDEKGGTTEEKKDPVTKPEEPKPAEPTPTPEAPKPPETTTTPPADSVKIAVTVPAVGAKWSETKTQSMDMAIEVDGQKGQLKREGVETKQIEVLAVDAEKVTKAKITYEVSDTQTMGGKPKAKPVPHNGKTYILDATGKDLAITLDGGAAPSAEELAAIKKAESRFGKSDRMAILVKDREFKKNEPVEFPADQIADLMGDEETKVTALKLTYVATSGANPVFEMAMTAVGEQPDTKIEMQLTGKATIDAKTGEAIEMTLEGPIKMTGKASATGTMKMTGTRTTPQ
jgi:hypothetical protein